MKKLKLFLYEEHEKVNFYSLHFEDEDCEFDKFQDKFPEGCEHEQDFFVILEWIDKIGKKGAFERYFRIREGKLHDRVCAIPFELEQCNIRLYAIRISDCLVILGNGDFKNTDKYNGNQNLEPHVNLLQAIDKLINVKVSTGAITIQANQIKGNLTFFIKEQNEKE